MKNLLIALGLLALGSVHAQAWRAGRARRGEHEPAADAGAVLADDRTCGERGPRCVAAVAVAVRGDAGSAAGADGEPAAGRDPGRTCAARPARVTGRGCGVPDDRRGQQVAWAARSLALSPRMHLFLDDLEAVHDASLIEGLERRGPEAVAEFKRRDPPVSIRRCACVPTPAGAPSTSTSG